MSVIALDGAVYSATTASANSLNIAGCAWSANSRIFVEVVMTGSFSVSSVTGGGFTWAKVTDGTTGASTNAAEALEVWATTTLAGSGASAQTITVNVSGSTAIAATVIPLTNCATGNVNKVVTASASPPGNPINPASITTSVGNTQILLVATAPSAATYSVPSGYTALTGSSGIVSGNGQDYTANLQTAANSSAGTFTPGSMGTTGSSPVGVIEIALVGSSQTAPSAPTFSNQTTSGIQVNLPGSLAAGNADYDIQRSTDNASWSTVATNKTGGQSFTDSGLTADTLYYYRFVGWSGAGSTGTSVNGTSANTDTLANSPSAPTYGTNSDTTAVVNLPSISGVNTGVTIQRSTDNSTWGTIATNQSGATYTDSGLTANTTYYYRLAMVDAGGTSAFGSSSSTITAPSPPTGITLTGQNNSVLLNWTNSTGDVSVNVYRSLTSDGSYSLLSAGTGVVGTTFTDATASNGTAYYYKLTSVNAGGESAQTTAQGPVTPYNVPIAPTGIGAVAGSSSITVSWSRVAVSGGNGAATQYRVYRSTGSGQWFAIALISDPTASYVDNSVSNNTWYNYYVTGIDNAGEGAASIIVSARIVTSGSGPMLKSYKLRGFQFGLESTSTPGTSVAASKKVNNGDFSIKRNNNAKGVKAMGHKSNIAIQRGKRWTDWKMSGKLGYNLLTYLGAMLIKAGVTPTVVGTLTNQWSYKMTSTDVDQPQTMTFEYGNSQQAEKCSFAFMTELDIKCNNDGVTYDAAGKAQYPTNNISMTASPTIISTVIMNPLDWRVNYATTFGALSSGKLSQSCKDWELKIAEKYKEQYFIDDVNNSFGGMLEKVPTINGSLIVAKGSDADNLLGNLENGDTVYLQFQATGPAIETVSSTTYYYSAKITVCANIINEDEQDSDELFAGKYDFESAEDTTNGDITIVTQTTLTTL